MVAQCVYPNSELIKQLVDADPRSLKKIFEAADLDYRLYNRWQEGHQVYRSSLKAFLEVVQSSQGYSVDDLIKKTPTTLDPSDIKGRKAAFRTLAIKALTSPEFQQACFPVADNTNATIGHFLYENHYDEVCALNLGAQEENHVYRQLADVGWLRQLDGHQGHGKFVLKEWTHRERKNAFRDRMKLEQYSIREALSLQLSACSFEQESFAMIKKHQQENLNYQKQVEQELKRQPSINAVLEIIRFDCCFHPGWAVHDPGRSTLVGIAVGRHLQPFYRLVAIYQQYVGSELTLPKHLPTIFELVEPFYTENKAIYDCFIATSPQDDVQIEKLMNMIEDHAAGYFEKISNVLDGFMEDARRRSV